MSDQGQEGAFARPYPQREPGTCPGVPQQDGLSKRELFAAMALQGLLANGECALSYDLSARYAVEHADVLLKVLAPTPAVQQRGGAAKHKRELIAAMALQGLLASGEGSLEYEQAAYHAVDHADALLEALTSGEVFS